LQTAARGTCAWTKVAGAEQGSWQVRWNRDSDKGWQWDALTVDNDLCRAISSVREVVHDAMLIEVDSEEYDVGSCDLMWLLKPSSKPLVQ